MLEAADGNYHWQRNETLFHAPLIRALKERTAFLVEDCDNDSGLSCEVEKLLRSDGAAESFVRSVAEFLLEKVGN
jgi:hypothetical protein